MANLQALSDRAIAWLNGDKFGGPLGASYALSDEVKLGTRLDEHRERIEAAEADIVANAGKTAWGECDIAGTDTVGTVNFGADFADGRAIGSLTSTDGVAVLSRVSAPATTTGIVTVTLGTAPGAGKTSRVTVQAFKPTT